MIGLSRLVSLAARAGCHIHQIVEQLESTHECGSYIARRVGHHDTSPGRSCPSAVAKALMDLYDEVQVSLGLAKPLVLSSDKTTGVSCPQCGAQVKFESGCMTCTQCGYSKCG